MRSWNSWICSSKRKKIFEQYFYYFEISEVKLKQPLSGTHTNHWLMALKLPERESRDTLLRLTNEQGIMTRPIWQLMYRLPMYANCQRDAQANAEFLEERIVNIPSSATLE